MLLVQELAYMEELEEMFEMQQEEEEMMEEEAAMEEEGEDDVEIHESSEFEQEIKSQLGNMKVSASDISKNIDTRSITARSKSSMQKYLK